MKLGNLVTASLLSLYASISAAIAQEGRVLEPPSLAKTLSEQSTTWATFDKDRVTIELALPAQVVQALIAAVQYIQSQSKENATNALQAQFQHEVISKLDEIISNTDLILAEVKALKDYLPFALDDAFRKAFIAQVGPQIHSAAVAVANINDPSNLSAEERASLLAHADEILIKTYALFYYGYASWFAVGTGTVSALGLYTLAKPKASGFEVQMRPFLDWLRDAGDFGVPGSLASAWKLAEDSKNSLGTQIDNYPRAGFLGSSKTYRATYQRSTIDMLGIRMSPEGDITEVDSSRLLDLLRTKPPDGPEKYPHECVSFYGNITGDENNFGFTVERVVGNPCNGRGWPLFPDADYTSSDIDWRAYTAAVHLNELSSKKRRVGQQQITLSQMFDGVVAVSKSAATIYENISH